MDSLSLTLCPFLCCRYSDSPTAELESRAPKSRSSKNKDGKGRHDKDGTSSENPRKNLRSSKVFNLMFI